MKLKNYISYTERVPYHCVWVFLWGIDDTLAWMPSTDAAAHFSDYAEWSTPEPEGYNGTCRW